MHRVILILVLLSSLIALPCHASAETVTFQSATYANFRQVLTQAEPAGRVEIGGRLEFPPAANGRVPAAVVIHTLAGYRDANEGRMADALREAGFATLTYDSFAARGMHDLETTPMRGPPPYPSAIADAFAALQLLSADPRIDPARIAILGFSFGGEVAHDTAFERLRTTLSKGGARFAAHVAFYPAGVYGAVAEAGAYTGAPILMMIGGDDTLPAAKAEAYLAYASQAGHPAPIDLVVYRNAHHGWTDPSLGNAREFPYLASTRACPFVLFPLRGPPALLIDGQAQPFDDRAFEACISKSLGYTMGYDQTARSQSTATAIAFLKHHLQP